MENKLIVTIGNNEVGYLNIYNSSGKEYYMFEYSDEWLDFKDSFSIDPELSLRIGQVQSRDLWGAFKDISPDRWGKILQDSSQAKFLSDGDYMLGVSDYMRLGALRLSNIDAPLKYLSEHKDIPKLTQLRTLENAVKNFEDNNITDEDLAILLEPGSSLGGARPKAVIEHEGKLYIAKFRSKKDSYRVINWEYVLLETARLAGINTSNVQLLNKDSDHSVLLVERFDRKNIIRVPFASVLTMCSGQCDSYLEMADIIRKNSSQFKADLQEIWKRMVFNAMTGNIDDHARNHALIRDANGWHLSPAYDLNPVPQEYSKRIHALSFDDGQNKPSLEKCIELAQYFALTKEEINEGLKKIYKSILGIESIAIKAGLTKSEINYMQKAFKHDGFEKLATIVG